MNQSRPQFLNGFALKRNFKLPGRARDKVEVFNEDTSKLESFSLLEEGELPFIDDSEKELTDKELDELNMWMYLKCTS